MTSSAGPRLFISYRRADSAGHAGRLYDQLASRYGADRIFMDVDNIAPGVDFAETILQALGGCAVTLVVIGPEWSGPKPDGSKRIDDDHDFVRIEVQTALTAGLLVVPLLVHGAAIPLPTDLPEPVRPLVARNALELRDSRWHADVARLVRTIDPILGTESPAEAPVPSLLREPGDPVAVRPDATPLRKVVTVLYIDITGWNELAAHTDPEAMQSLLDRYVARVSQIIHRHGGRVEQVLGDSVVAVFGVPDANEDDAARAVRAAVDARADIEHFPDAPAVAQQNHLRLRAGINTGEVVVGDPAARQPFSVGDAVNVAAQLVHHAQPGEILVGDTTTVLIQDAADVRPAADASFGGGERAAGVVVSLKPLAPVRARSVGTPLVGREPELAVLRRSYEEAVSERQCRVVTLVGEPGVGKTRLALEIASQLDDATLVTGRCLSYGEGITFWPVAQAMRNAVGLVEGESRDVVHERMTQLLPDAPDLVARLENMLHAEPGGSAQELFLATRRFFEALASTQPVVTIFDDVHWGEATFLDLVEYLASWVQAPMLIVATARPEVLDVRPHWTRAAGMTTVNLSPLSRGDSARLLSAVLGPGRIAPALTQHVTGAAGGNPLYMEQLLHMFSDEGALVRRGESWSLADAHTSGTVPPGVHALIGARLDRLPDDLTALVQRAAVVGVEFSGEAVAALAPGASLSETAANLAELVRKEFIVAQPSAGGSDDSYRFRHGLVRDVAYANTSKRVRADLHARFAGWLDETLGDDLGDVDEILGSHLADAAQLRMDLALVDATTQDLGRRAVSLLATAGRRALSRSDLPAAAKLLRRGVALALDDRATAAAIALDLFESLREMGELSAAADLLPDIVADARTAGDRRLAARAEVAKALLDTHLENDVDPDDVVEAVHAALDVLVAAGDDMGCAQAYQVLADVHWNDSSFAAAQKDLEAALEYATNAGAAREQGKVVTWLAAALLWGPTHAVDAALRCEEILQTAVDDRMVEGRILMVIGGLYAMQGRFDDARDAHRRGRQLLEDLGMTLPVASGTQISGMIETLAGDLEAAERELRSGYDALSAMGERGYLPAAAAFLGTVLAAQGRAAEAEQIARELAAMAPDDEIVDADGKSIDARIAIHSGECDRAVPLAEDAVAAYRESDEVKGYADSLLLLAQSLLCAGDAARAGVEAQEARRLFVSKGIAPSVAVADGIIARAGAGE